MESRDVSFEQILNATLRMLRTAWKTPVCLFLQTDDHGGLQLRAADGIPAKLKMSTFVLKSIEGPSAECLANNKVIEIRRLPVSDPLTPLLKPHFKKGQKYVMVPVSGEVRVLGIVVLGPFSEKEKILPREAELRSAGALCAVLSAHWRLYDWMSHFLPEVNHELRTPLTAIQGSIGMVLGGIFGQVGGEVKEMLEMAHKGCERTVRAIENYLNNQNLPKE
jgi:hypothetical protein